LGLSKDLTVGEICSNIVIVADIRDFGKNCQWGRMMVEAKVAEQISPETQQEAIQRARDRANATMWSLEVFILSFAILIVVIILLFWEIKMEIVASVAILGLATVWFMGRRRGRQLYRNFYDEEITKLEQEQKKVEEETIEDKVRKALQDRWR